MGRRCPPATAEQVRGLLAEGIPACTHCRPDTVPSAGYRCEGPAWSGSRRRFRDWNC
ncbi:DUF6233 domain-containing protein [Streptomyces xanthophaeus]